MTAYYCGFNGFRQFPVKNIETTAIYNPTEFPFQVTSVSLAWNYLFYISESKAYISGFINGEIQKVEQISLPNDKQIRKGSCSSKCALFIAEDGCCWIYRSSGLWKNVSPLLNSETHSEVEGAQESCTIHKIVQACCQDKINVVLCELGQVYSIPTALPIPGRKVTEIACGFEHCLMVTDICTVFSWGSGRRGQLGHDMLEDEDSPREVDALSGLNVKSVAAGGWHSVAITATGDAYVWGWNTSGQLGMPCSENRERLHDKNKDHASFDLQQEGTNVKDNQYVKSEGEVVTVQAFPLPIKFPYGLEDIFVKSAACGNRHTIILTDDGVAWGCGWNAYGQLGLSGWTLYESLTKILIHGKEDCKVKEVVCGGWSTVLYLDKR
ncbi:hypothetical protein J437_LFUL003039 [Ladona fulva]|uniref:RCC1 domain-containing protein 1 n=1 Tax=Ladona fulva TaxID=123851 RepID=A0A8K0JXE4_LADFU|nr:hypothetical protein J437_LFUL003039 [Ladona fulva]